MTTIACHTECSG